MEGKGREGGRLGRDLKEFWLLVEPSWALGPLEHNDLNEPQNQLTN